MAHRQRLVCSLALVASAACAHAPSAEPGGSAEDKDHEVAVLRERMGRLERRLSDLDAQLKLVSERVADQGGPQQVSLGAPLPYEPHRPSYDERPRAPAYERMRAAPPGSEPRAPSWEETPGLRSIDLGTMPPRAGYPADPEAGLDEEEEALFDGAELGSEGTDAPALAATPAPPGDVKSQYDWAHARMKSGRYDDATAAFEAILRESPEHRLADNALYWIGVCHLERGQPRRAIDTWKKLPLRFPDSAKMADSLFGMAMAHEKLSEPVLAETLYMQLAQQYPKAEKVGEARRALKRLSGSPDAPR